MMAMSFNQYDKFLSENDVVSGTTESRMVSRVGDRIANAVERYMQDHGMASRVEGYEWEFNLIGEDVPNAWCMPGGKVVFYTGILPYTEDEAGMAVVMGHEIAHAIARHGNERMSQQLMVQAGGAALSVYLDEKDTEHQELYLAAYGVGTTVGVALPYSRAHETEADKLGLIFMAMAGYDPAEAVEFWKRMSQSGGAKPPEFLSTHPSDETRIENLKKFLPEARKYIGK
jgi:predicted Zn-dependent protease